LTGLFRTGPDGYTTFEERNNITAAMNVGEVKQNSRPFPKAIAGDLVMFSFNTSTLAAQLIYKPSKACDQPTEVFVPSGRYALGCRRRPRRPARRNPNILLRPFTNEEALQ
jgi:hypothetical protein